MQGRLDEAEAHLLESLAIYRDNRDGRHPNLGKVGRALAEVYQQKGDLPRAAQAYREVIEHVGDDPKYDNSTQSHLVELGVILNTLEEHEEAESVLRRCVALREKLLPDHWWISSARSLLGEALTGQRRFGEAEPMLLVSYDDLRNDPDSRAMRVPSALERIIALYEAWDKAEPGAGKDELADKYRAMRSSEEDP